MDSLAPRNVFNDPDAMDVDHAEANSSNERKTTTRNASAGSSASHNVSQASNPRDEHTSSSSGAGNENGKPSTPAEPVGDAGSYQSFHDDSHYQPYNVDLANSITGMHRILDSISERGHGGLVAKIIIAQDSIGAFLNSIRPGSYRSPTRINFHELDLETVNPLGIYGSKEEIVKFLRKLGVVDGAIAHQLLKNDSDDDGPMLRSGLYVVCPPKQSTENGVHNLYVVYWPEGTTWNDDAPDAVRRSRVTFMRYMMQLTDQIVALISPEHAKGIRWQHDSLAPPSNSFVDDGEDDDADDRLFRFEVAKTKEQEENVTVRSGFKMSLSAINIPQVQGSSILEVRLIPGETTQAILVGQSLPARRDKKMLSNGGVTEAYLRELIFRHAIRLSEGLDDDAIKILIKCGLDRRFGSACNTWQNRKRQAETQRKSAVENPKAKVPREDVGARVRDGLRLKLVETICEKFPSISREKFQCLPPGQGAERAIERLGYFLQQHQQFQDDIDQQLGMLDSHLANHLKLPKFRFTLLSILYDDETLPRECREDLIPRVWQGSLDEIRSICQDPLGGRHGKQPKRRRTWLPLPSFQYFFGAGVSVEPMTWNAYNLAKDTTDSTPDSDFLSQLHSEPDLREYAFFVEATAVSALSEFIRTTCTELVHKAQQVYQEFCERRLKAQADSREKEALDQARDEFKAEINKRTQSNAARPILFLNDLGQTNPSKRNPQYSVSGWTESEQLPEIKYTIFKLDLDREDQHALQSDPMFTPTPKVEQRFSYSQYLSPESSLAFAQILPRDKVLLAIKEKNELRLRLDGISKSSRDRGKTIKLDRLGEFLVAFDEQQRLLVVCSCTHLGLHLYKVTSDFVSIEAWGSPVKLSSWYESNATICFATFVCGSDDLLLIDSSGLARIYSFTTQGFKPATLQLPQLPTAAYSSPDGSCLVLNTPGTCGRTLRAYHWATFGESDGITIEPPPSSDGCFVMTSFVNRNTVHIVSLDHPKRCCHSIALDIARKETEFMFKRKGFQIPHDGGESLHNAILDCHSEVWTRFPVEPAVRRQTLTSGSRQAKSMLFVSDRNHGLFRAYFSAMIRAFKQQTRKPTGDQSAGDKLQSIRISSVSFEAFIEQANDMEISSFSAGEWLVELLCLIPIQIAITQENRFVPLKDGIFSTEFERSLLGAEVGQIADSLSFGWYESLFQSYYSQKVVKVVSSMGEQSVGKSYALNHLVDTSFAGSAMRTTEGVWMSITPTRDALIVALDFEGVHSIERTNQEDTLLVLFNAAISNLVIFRNNFALSRDISEMCQSFQSSSVLLEPSENPSLFRSTLAIVIKDVVESDKDEIVKEFQLKFQKIVQDEQDANFITRLHGGNLHIIPWPIIESTRFYTLFTALKRTLDKQTVTHHTAGEFLMKVKMLMAKLKANDWGSLDQNLVAHRAQQLHNLLATALRYGLSDVEAKEPLKNFDSDETVDHPDTDSVLYLPSSEADPTSCDVLLANLRMSWERDHPRQVQADEIWIAGLANHLSHIIDSRIAHVGMWLTSNLSHFKVNHASVELLKRSFEAAGNQIRMNMDLCKIRCNSCELLCIQSRSHDSGGHNCGTAHVCVQPCEFFEEHSERPENCSYVAGHSGKHICAVGQHLCGERCVLFGKLGCLNQCTKVAKHSDEEDHLCSAAVHMCGEPCSLRGIRLPNGQIMNCPGSCRTPRCVKSSSIRAFVHCLLSHEIHQFHTCEDRRCPVQCQLCSRLCSNSDHLHGLDRTELHLCGQEHSCSENCSARGICEIDTTPQSIEATFSGRHENFQYTKYTQAAKRLACIIPITPGELRHGGEHCHSMDARPFHFCEAKCENCGYYCTLPLGHPQPEHETRHGSMTATRWAIDGEDEAVMELNGRRFSANDDGAPMMCSLVCKQMGRHVHIDFCRATDNPCSTEGAQHIRTRMLPSADRPKDFITHNLYWRRSGFKDPYTREEQAEFSKCDAMCPGPEHLANGSTPAQPSFCILPTFHPPQAQNARPAGTGYVSNDGHAFACNNPVIMHQAFHVLFVIDRSGSMSSRDRGPLPNTPVTGRISATCSNRLGAVYSSLWSFWSARQGVLAGHARRDAYSVIAFDHQAQVVLENDFASSPEDLLNSVMRYGAGGGTDYAAALTAANDVMNRHWSSDRMPVVIFLSDGECGLPETTALDFARNAVRLGKPLSLHTVSFGTDRYSLSLRRMKDLAQQIQATAPRDPLGSAPIECSYSSALDTVQLTNTFLGIANSLRKTRGALLRQP